MLSKPSRIILAAMAIMAVAELGIWSAHGDDKKSEQPAQSPASQSTGATTNSLPSRRKGDGLKSLEQDLFRPFDTVAPKGSLDGAFAPPEPEPPPATPVIQSKRAKELLERRRDWAFETPEEILAAPTTDDLLKGRDKQKNGEDKGNLSPIERFYDRLYNKDKKETKYNGSKGENPFEPRKLGTAGDEGSADDDPELPAGVQAAQREMRKLLTAKERKEDNSVETSKGIFSDVFGLHRDTPRREEVEMQRERMDRYKESLGLPVTPNLENDPLKAFRDMLGTSPKSAVLLPSMDTSGGLPQQNPLGTSGAPGGAAANNPLLPEAAKVYAPSSLAPALPKMDPPRSLPPPISFDAPRRSF